MYNHSNNTSNHWTAFFFLTCGVFKDSATGQSYSVPLKFIFPKLKHKNFIIYKELFLLVPTLLEFVVGEKI